MAKYLLFRQNAAQMWSMRKPALIELLDRKRTGDYAIELLNQFEAADDPTRDRWAVVLAALLADDYHPTLGQPTSKGLTAAETRGNGG